MFATFVAIEGKIRTRLSEMITILDDDHVLNIHLSGNLSILYMTASYNTFTEHIS